MKLVSLHPPRPDINRVFFWISWAFSFFCKIFAFCPKDMIQIHVFLELLFSLDCHFGSFNLKMKPDRMFIFRCWFFEIFSFWPIKSADLQDSCLQSKIWTRWCLYNYINYIESMFSCKYEPILVRIYQLWDSLPTWNMMLFG